MESDLMPRQSVIVGDTSFDTVVLGDGPPTVVFVNGLGSPLEEWALVAPAIAQRVRVFCYDRRTVTAAGRVPTHSAADSAADLYELLAALALDGPIVLVGHSWGGAVIRRYAADHPKNVVGMVYVDASHENMKAMTRSNAATRALYTGSMWLMRRGLVRRRLLRTLGFERLPAETLALVDKLPWLAEGRTARAEYAGIAPSLLELGRTAPDLPPVPTRVLLAGGRPGLAAKLSARQIAMIRGVWEQAVAGRPNGTLDVVPNSGHYISLDQPQAVIDAIEDVVASCR